MPAAGRMILAERGTKARVESLVDSANGDGAGMVREKTGHSYIGRRVLPGS